MDKEEEIEEGLSEMETKELKESSEPAVEGSSGLLCECKMRAWSVSKGCGDGGDDGLGVCGVEGWRFISGRLYMDMEVRCSRWELET